MRFGGMFGITAPMVLVQKLRMDQFKRINTLLNNKADSEALYTFKQEINLIKDVYNHRFRLSPNDPSGNKKRKYRKFKQSERFWESEELKKASSSYYEEPTELPPNIWTKEELDNYRKTILPRLDMEIVAFRDIYGEYGKEVSKDSEDPIYKAAYDIASLLYKKVNFLTNVYDSIVINPFVEVRVFNNSLYSFINKDSYYVQYRVIRDIQTKTGNFQRIEINKLKESLETIDSYINNSEDIRNEGKISKDLETISKNNGLNIQFTKLGKTKPPNKEDLKQLYKFFKQKYPEYGNYKILPEIIGKRLITHITYETLEFLEELYTYCKSFNVSYYNSLFGLNLDEWQYKKVFGILEDYGIIGLTLESDKLFIDSLDKLHLTGEQVHSSATWKPQAHKNIDCLRKYYDTLIPFGEVI